MQQQGIWVYVIDSGLRKSTNLKQVLANDSEFVDADGLLRKQLDMVIKIN
jgi:hypothetical protein